MKVYRYMSKSELISLMKENFENVGSFPYDYNKNNNHKYEINKKYIHFFKNKESMKQIKLLRKDNQETFYFCEFDIPFRILVKYVGKGCYTHSGYDQDYDTLKEYAIPVNVMKASWFSKAKADDGKNIDLAQIFSNNDDNYVFESPSL